jgi:CubicO group peptidase (beta-lactamase class C family)
VIKSYQPIRVVIVASAAALLSSWRSPVDAETRDGQSLSSAGRTYLSRVLDQAVARNDTPGVVALVVDRNHVLYEGAAGTLHAGSDQPMPNDAIFKLASMTKPVTTVAAMILVEQGKLRLDDPVSTFLPGFENLKVIQKFNEADGSYETRPAARVMTIRHLLTHTSGIGYAFSNPIVSRLQAGSQKEEWQLPLLHDPGAMWTYGASTSVLGLIIEKLTDTSLEAFDQERIFKPLGMVDTSYAVAAGKQARVTSSYRHVGQAFQPRPQAPIPSIPTPPFYGDSGLYSTARDYGRFMQMLLNGGHLGKVRILSAHSVRLMGENQIGAIVVTQQPAADPALTRPFPLGAGHDKFGLGFQIASKDANAASYRSPGSLSWAGLLNTEFWVDPQRHLGGVVLMQFLPFYDEGAIRTLREFEAAVYQQLPQSIDKAVGY